MIKLHPIIVHFPIAFLCAAALFAFLSFFIKKEIFKEIVFWNLLLGLLGATLAVFTGLLDEQHLIHNEEIHTLLQKHKFNGIAIIFVFQILLIWFGLRRKILKNKEYMLWFICLLFGVSMIFYQGFLGGRMVYDLGAGVTPMEKQIEKDEKGSANPHEHNKGNPSDDMKGMDMNSDNKSDTNKNSKDDMKGMDMNNDNKTNSTKDKKDDMDGMNMSNDDKSNFKKNDKGDMNNKNNTKSNEKEDMKGMDMNNNKNNPKQSKKNEMGGMNMPGMVMGKKNAMDTIILEDNNPTRKSKKKNK